MKNLFLLFLILSCTSAFAGKIQRQGIKTPAECVAGGSTAAACSPSSDQIYDTVNNQILSTTIAGIGSSTQYVWRGYFDGTCEWSWSGATGAYADPAADATCALNETKNINFPAVSALLSAGNKLPGITFTASAPMAGEWAICSSPVTDAGSVGANYLFTDQNTFRIFEVGDSWGTATVNAVSKPMCQGYTMVAGAQTFKWEARQSGGTIYIRNGQAYGGYSGASTIEWWLRKL